MKTDVKRPTPSYGGAPDIRPVVGRRSRPAPVWLLFGVAALGGVVLFSVLDGQRRATTAPTAQLRTVDRVGLPSVLPPLYIPPEPPPPPLPETVGVETVPLAPAPPQFAPPIPPQIAPQSYPQPAFAPPVPGPAPAFAQTGGTGAVLVVDTTGTPEAGAGGAAVDTAPVRTTRLSRQAMTVPQGTLIPAVLETALDSTRPGHVRAFVSRDIAGFDGSRILIPRGSRLFGEYQSDMGPGQNRALVQWTRLVRPDGVSIALGSPATDMQGRSGVEGRVNSRFLERFGAALLQTTVNVGTSLATRNLGGDASVILAPGAALPAAAPASGRVEATLRVEAGARVAVLVARDLEFASGDVRP